eukprot:CAMPEP_0194768150 /NCGR_PEP_ID=MMETSP0323_2-20130528/38486_1 /TAXON_ID=2866 ORGANISM="Crypthecodinium cohnii, Strain Seligo" /NCGR_SAMPLE_ID=MMETSP0323_2 /ASSEMBLY_ACC=CAM_ASM_000346 /LENGTH=62 /DNA_ID=CAMNT_0039700333 /DNA_START=246 /DNA_END=434 /DNA_ORIENTATION=+
MTSGGVGCRTPHFIAPRCCPWLATCRVHASSVVLLTDVEAQARIGLRDEGKRDHAATDDQTH